ncbi:RTA1 like protein-domain-containing protein [Leptodontidium sp. MPI-SDFR-AT-0119]|nr:RTA1 like protein-domain-containing protein [Leptodontidium sp. MPI-SDFR-AT-0119]
MAERNYFDYEPSLPAAIVFAVLYTIPCIVTVYQYFALKCWFWIFMVIAALMEAIGYIARIISVRMPTEMVPYSIQFLCVFLAPAVIAASCYMAMGQVVLHVTPLRLRTFKTLWVTPRWMTPIFVGYDVLAFVQILGGVQVTSDNPQTVLNAFKIMKVGLAIQLLCFGLFLVIAIRFHFVSRSFRQNWPDSKWTKFLWAVNVSAILIFIRSIYCMIEFNQGEHGHLITHEWCFYVFEATVMLPCIVLFNIFHPAHYVSNIGFRQKRGAETISWDAEGVENMHLQASNGLSNST